MNLYHYCSNINLISILESKEIWASELSLSNDQMEGRWIREIFRQHCNEEGVSASNQNDLLTHLDTVIAVFGGAGFCMSEDGDLLSQWRAYADGGAGVSIGFAKEYFEELGPLKRDRNDDFSAHLTKVEYDLAKQKTAVAEHLTEILKLVSEGALRRPTLLDSDADTELWKAKFRNMTFRFIFFFPYLYSLKNHAFAEEREWRVISHLIRNPKTGEQTNISKMEFRGLPDRIVPFTRIKLEPLTNPSITEVVLGPRNITPVEIVKGLLAKNQWTDISVWRSKASYR